MITADCFWPLADHEPTLSDDCSRCTPDVGPVNLTDSSGSTAAIAHERFVMDSSESRYPLLAWSSSVCLAAFR
jgi:hypothetical protein